MRLEFHRGQELCVVPRKPTIVVDVYPFSLTHTHMLIFMVYRDSPMFFMLYKLYVLLLYT